MTDYPGLVAAIGAVVLGAALVARRSGSPRRAEKPPTARATVSPTVASPSGPPAPEMATGELLVLASAYLCAVPAGDADTKRLIMSTVTGRELLAGLTLVGRALTAEHGDTAVGGTAQVLAELHRDAVRRHRETVLLAHPQDPVT